MNEFTLRIKLGNEAMQNAKDVADALSLIANDVRYMYSDNILDYNGNKVGEWGFTK